MCWGDPPQRELWEAGISRRCFILELVWIQALMCWGQAHCSHLPVQNVLTVKREALWEAEQEMWMI